ncbi:hypothetical protein RQN30_10920 [Arcanobacterium hippocoleae]
MFEYADENQIAQLVRGILRACGGYANICGIDSEISRLEVQVVSNAEIDVQMLRNLGAAAVVLQKKMVQIIIGEVAESLHYLLAEKLEIVPEGY